MLGYINIDAGYINIQLGYINIDAGVHQHTAGVHQSSTLMLRYINIDAGTSTLNLMLDLKRYQTEYQHLPGSCRSEVDREGQSGRLGW